MNKVKVGDVRSRLDTIFLVVFVGWIHWVDSTSSENFPMMHKTFRAPF